MASAAQTTPPPAQPQPLSWQYVLRIVAGCALLWVIFHRWSHRELLWAIISVIIVTEPELSAALLAFNSRIVNTLIGCAVAFPLLYFLGPNFWSILLGITISVFVSAQVIKVPGSWRVAPVTVAIVMTPGLLESSRSASFKTAIDRTVEVLIGSVVALLITFLGALIKRLAGSFAARV
jgi:uncharacterized membrane protein YccC